METVVSATGNRTAWAVVSDDRCPVVQFLARLIRQLDRRHFFHFVKREDQDLASQSLVAELDACPWSLLLIDNEGERRQGPEAIPFILKNLPQGRLAVAIYLLPGTMWLTRQLYLLVSRSKLRLTPKPGGKQPEIISIMRSNS